MFTGFDLQMVEAIMQERMREAAELQIRRQARALQGQDASSRRALSGLRARRLPLFSLNAGRRVARVFKN